ncbi:serine/arginine-rich splicing factor 4-like [Anneissia japonica]|uniref:serine/arginine-rich splicing factor 4-like n=1 Tax=Anneissia japonica TaxID=1529436 RepID=UPI001425790C|nr:serine/arginine-rich splicing factor 4-like [Anneissia japonica]
MMENSDLPKRKRSTDKAEGDSLEVLIVRKLTHERIDELKKQIKSDQLRYKTLRREIDQLKAGQLDKEVRTMWEELQTKDREASEEAGAEKLAVDNARLSSSGKNVVRGGVKKPSPKLKNSQETESTLSNDIDTMEIDVVSTTPQAPTPPPVSKPLPVLQDITPIPTNDVSSRESSNGKNTDVGRAHDSVSMDVQQVAEKPGKGVPPPSIEAKDKKKVEANQHEKTSEKKREEKLDVSKVKKSEDLKHEKRKGDKFDAKMDKDEDKIVEQKVKKNLEQTIGKKDTSQENTDNHKEKKADVKYEPKKDKKEYKQEEKTSTKTQSTKASPAGKELHPATEGEHTDSSKVMSKDGVTKQAAAPETSKPDEMKQTKKVILKKPEKRKSGRGKRKSSDTQEDGGEKKDKSSDPSSIDDEKNEDKSETSEMEEVETRRSESDRDDQSIRGVAFCESMPNSPASITPRDRDLSTKS